MSHQPSPSSLSCADQRQEGRQTAPAPANRKLLRTRGFTQYRIRLPRVDPYRLLLLLAMVTYVIVYTRLAFDLHAAMRTHRSDLGQIAQAVWNSSQGRFVEMTDNGFIATRMTDHVEPILALMSPVLWLWQDVRALLLLQVLLVALGAWPLYELALQQLDTLLSPRERSQIWQIEPLRRLTRPLALTVALAYLLTPQLQSAVLTEFHAAPLAVPFILWAFWAVGAERLGQFGIATLLVAATKEEMALLAAGLALWQCWRAGGNQRIGGRSRYFVMGRAAGLLGLCLLWFYLATFVIVPAHALQVYESDQSVYFARYGALGSSPTDIMKSLHPAAACVANCAGAGPACLPGFNRAVWPIESTGAEILLLSLPLLLANLLSAYPAQYYGDFHYSAPLVPYVAVSAAYGLARLWRWVGRYTSGSSASYQHMAAANTGVMAVVSLLTNARTALRPLIALSLTLWLLTWASVTYLQSGRGPGAARYDAVVESSTSHEHHRLLPYFLAQVPPDAAITATAAVHPHLSLRRYIYQFPLGVSELGTAGAATWALLDVTTNTDMAPGDLKRAVETMIAGEWGIVDGADGFLLLRRGASAKAIPSAFYDFVRSTATSTVSRSGAAAGSTTQLIHTSTADWPRWRQIRVQADWLVGEDVLTGPITPTLEIVTPDGELLQNLTTMASPALVWYPPARWQLGEHIHVTSLPLWLPRIWGLTTNPMTATGQAVADELVTALSADGQRALVDVVQYGAAGAIDLPLIPGSPPATMTRLNPATARFVDSAGNGTVTLQAWGTPTTISPGNTLSLWLRWSGNSWPKDKTVFVHLRADGRTLTQRDGVPRFFVYYAPDTLLAQRGVIDDLRQLPIPTELHKGDRVSVVVGLYDTKSGVRSAIVDGAGTVVGDEWHIGEFVVQSAPVPDQACAMIPASCDAQVKR
ncbi:MAG: DUF2079 domain-containing protein [Caldilineaceae bacterium]